MPKNIKDRIQNYGFYLILIGAFLVSTQCDKQPILIQSSDCKFFVYEEQKKILLDHCKLWDDRTAFFAWDSCCTKCCQADFISQFPTISYDALSACDPSLDDSQKDTYFLISKICIITSISILLLVSLMIIRDRLKLCRKINIFCAAQSCQLQQLLRLDQLTTNIEDIKWTGGKEVEHRLVDQSNSCCICLQDNCNTLLSCQHYYHHHCIASWMDKKRSCPLCQKDRIGILKIYCKSCHTYYFSCEYNLIIKEQSKASILQCKNCEAIQQASRQQFIHQIILSKTSLYEHH